MKKKTKKLQSKKHCICFKLSCSTFYLMPSRFVVAMNLRQKVHSTNRRHLHLYAGASKIVEEQLELRQGHNSFAETVYFCV
jgi:hypothetical protein